MVSPSPTDANNRTSIFALGFTMRVSRSPTTGVAIMRRGRRTSTGQQRSRLDQDEPTNAVGVRQGIPQGPRATHRVAGQRACLQPESGDDLVDERNRRFSEARARNVDGLAQPESRPIHGDRPHTLEPFEHGKERER